MISEMFNMNEQDTCTFILLSLPRYVLDFILRQTTLVACDGDMTRLAGCLVGSQDIKNTVGVALKSNLVLGTPRGTGETPECLNLPRRLLS
jgi:NAD-specific glutamate dehydrogenase